MPRGCLTTHRGDTRVPFLPSVEDGYGGVSYLECVTGIWVDFMDITKGKWSRHQSLGFSKLWLVTWVYLILLSILG